MIVLDEALVLQVREYSESSQIVAFWTRRHGRVTGIVKGVRRQDRRAFDGPFETATHVEIGFYPRRQGEGLCILSESSLQARFAPVRESLEGWWAWSEASEAVLALTREMDPHPEVFEALEALMAGGGLPVFLLRLLQAAGNTPALETCAGCGSTLPERLRVSFAFWVGGAVCASCRQGPLAPLPVALRLALAAAARGAEVPEALRRPAESLLARYVGHLAGDGMASASCRDRSRRALRRWRVPA